MTLDEFEKQNNITFPSAYKRIYATGDMEWMEKSYSYISENYNELINKNYFSLPPLGDCRFIPFEHINETLDELNEMIIMDGEFSGYIHEINPKFRILPFATMLSGDIYCFLYDINQNKEPSILLYGHDTGDWDLWAESFDSFIYSQLISAIVDWDNPIDSTYITNQIKYLDVDYQQRFANKDIEALKNEPEYCFEVKEFSIYMWKDKINERNKYRT